jgi:MFS family permease
LQDAPDAAADPAVPRSAPRFIFLMCGAEILGLLTFSTFVTLLPQLVTEFALNNTQAGMISGMLFGGYMASVPLLGPLTDRVDPRRIFLCASLISAIGAFGFAQYAGGFGGALLCQALLGIGLAGTYVPGLKLLGDRLEGKTQARGTAFFAATFGIGTSASMVVSGLVATAYGWRGAFVAAGIGPLIAATIVMGFVRRRKPTARSRAKLLANLLDYRPVFRNRIVRPYLFAGTTHAWELFGLRSWLVAFLVFADSLRPEGGKLAISAAVIAALINLLGPVASVTGNELALRYGRPRIIAIGATLSGVGSCLLGFLADAHWIVLLTFAGVHMMLVLIDASSITSGLMGVAAPEQRGATLAVFSFLSFGTGFISPAAFGLVLDLAGGRGTILAWGLAFGSLGVIGMASLIAAAQMRKAHLELDSR